MFYKGQRIFPPYWIAPSQNSKSLSTPNACTLLSNIKNGDQQPVSDNIATSDEENDFEEEEQFEEEEEFEEEDFPQEIIPPAKDVPLNSYNEALSQISMDPDA